MKSPSRRTALRLHRGGFSQFASNVQTQSKAARAVASAPLVRASHQGIEDARQRCALDGGSAVADLDADKLYFARHLDAHGSILCPILDVPMIKFG
jgi:hypothetical protein